MARLLRYARPVLRLLIVSMLVVSALLAGVAVFLRQNPAALAGRLAHEVSVRTGMECLVGSVDVAFFPVPSLALADVLIRGENTELSIAYASVRPAVLPLLRGEFEPGSVLLLRPRLRMRLTDAPAPEAVAFPLRIPDMLDQTEVNIYHGSLDLARGGWRLLAQDVRTDVRLRAPTGCNGVIETGPAILKEDGAPVLLLEALRVQTRGQALAPPDGAAASLSLRARLRLPGLADQAEITCALARTREGGASSLEFQTTAAGRLTLQGAALPFTVAGRGAGSLEEGVRLDEGHLALDKDRAELTGMLRLRGDAAPSLEGTLNLQRCSLTQWFGFARQMLPGLQRSLDDLQGSLDFRLTTLGLKVPRIHVTAADGQFVGQGSVERWSAPVVALQLSAPRLTLEAAIPESLARYPDAPAFSHPPLTPLPGTPEAAAMPGPDIGYDIRLRVKELGYGPLALGAVEYDCAPGPDGAVLMNFGVGRFYGGKGEGRLTMRRQDAAPPGNDRAGDPAGAAGATRYAIKASLSNIQVDPAMAALGAGGLLSGRLTLDSDFSAQAASLDQFLRTLGGYALLRLDNGALGGDSQGRLAFTRLNLETRAKAAPAVGAPFTYAGQWKAALDAPQIKASMQLDGPLSFSAQPAFAVHARKAQGSLSLTVDKELTKLSEGIKSTVSGLFSLNTGQGLLAVDDAHAELWGMRLTGRAQVTAGPLGAQWQGSLAAVLPDTRRILNILQPTLVQDLPKNTLGAGKGQADFTWGDHSLTLNNLKLTVDATTLSGSCEGRWKTRPQWKFNLNADTLNLDRYLPPARPTGGGPAKASAEAPPQPPWSLRWIKENDAQGTLRVQNLSLRKFTVRDLRAPLRLKDGTLHCAEVKGTFYGAPLTLDVRATAEQALTVQTSMEASGVDMQSLCVDRGMRTVLGGRGTFQLRLHGGLRRGADIPAALSGSWRMHIKDAFMQSRDAKGTYTGSRTRMGTVQAEGSMDKGVLRSDKLSMAGPDIQAQGGGWVNLDKDTLDVNMVVNMPRIPEFPVRFYGSLDNPQRSINAGKAIVGALGSLGSGVLDVMGNVLGGVWGGAKKLLE